MHNIRNLLDNFASSSASDRELAVKIHNYVRDEIRFGFTRKFDLAEPEYTLEQGYGHSNPKGVLFTRLLKDVGINSQLHFITTKKKFLEGAIPSFFYGLLPEEISHSYAEVNISGKYLKVDSYIVDKALHRAILNLLFEKNLHSGFGVYSGSSPEWDGKTNNFVQIKEKESILEDHGSFEEPEDYFFKFSSYKHQFLGIQFSYALNLFSELSPTPFEIWVNSELNHIRTGKTL
ncbi:MAG: transglutaminase domain-containing protein [Leptospiraceae bacterium]|nr:transglutaminase domain-containing protein [Leptospiraceae bacterium]